MSLKDFCLILASNWAENWTATTFTISLKKTK
jgi:hypothetical protein